MAKTLFGKKQTPLIIGNWKMNPQTEGDSQKLFTEIHKGLGTKNALTVVAIAAPMVFIGGLTKLAKKSRIGLASQDVHYEASGTHTGETSLSMIKSLGVSTVLIGHSERRKAGETNEIVRLKTEAALQSGVTAVVCVGETIRDTHGDYFNVVQEQLRSVFLNIKKIHLSRLVIAYEPIWAISQGDGKGKTATAEDAHEMKLFIQKCIVESFGRSAVPKVRVLYGGSVNEDNAQVMLEEGRADGFLVGGASLKPQDFVQIIKLSDAYGKS
jgi:triosephosphate isomerase